MISNLKISEIKSLVKDKLEMDMLSLPISDRIKVEYPLKVEEYSLNDPRGVLLVIYKGSDYQKSSVENYIKQDRDVQIGVIAVMRKSNSGMDVDDYVDFIKESLSGIEIEVNRVDKKTYLLRDELMKEEAGEWWYGVTLIVPTISIEKTILDNQ